MVKCRESVNERKRRRKLAVIKDKGIVHIFSRLAAEKNP